MIDGCTPLRTFFSVVLPIMKPTYISVGILETMWIWNDFLLPYLVLDLNKYKTISIAIQYMKGSYGRVDMGKAVTTPKPTKPTPTKSPDFSALPNFMTIHKPMTVKMIGIITLAPKLMI